MVREDHIDLYTPLLPYPQPTYHRHFLEPTNPPTITTTTQTRPESDNHAQVVVFDSHFNHPHHLPNNSHSIPNHNFFRAYALPPPINTHMKSLFETIPNHNYHLAPYSYTALTASPDIDYEFEDIMASIHADVNAQQSLASSKREWEE